MKLPRISLRRRAPYSNDPTRGLQPPVGMPAEEWVYRPGPIIKPAGANGPFVPTWERDLAAERREVNVNDVPRCSHCGTELDPKWCDPEARAAVGDR